METYWQKTHTRHGKTRQIQSPMDNKSEEKGVAVKPEIASQYDISIRWVRKLWARYGQIKPAAISYPLSMGRPVSGLPGRREHSATIWAHHINGAGAVTIQE